MQMKSILLLCLGLLLGSVVFAQQQISIDQCYELARKNYPLIRRQGLIGQSEQYNLSNAGRGYLPLLSVNAKATYQSDVTELPVKLPGVTIPTLNKDQYQVVAELNQPLWDGGRIRSQKKVVKAASRSDEQQLEVDLYTINDRVNQLYFGILLFEEQLRLNELLQSDLQVNVKKINAMIDNGVANLSDAESMAVELLDARQQAIEIGAGRTAYLQMLSALIGQPLHEATALELPVTVADSLSQEINRPELKFFDLQTDWVQTQSSQLTAGVMPTLGLFAQGGYGRPGLNMLKDEFSPFWVGGIRLSWSMGGLYTLKNDRRKLKIRGDEIGVQREVFLFNTRLLQTQQNNEIQKVKQLIGRDDEIVLLRTRIKQAGEQQLVNGVISVTDLIRDINAESRARQTRALHQVQEQMAIYNYKYITNN